MAKHAQKRSKLKVALISLAVLAVVAVGASAWYVNDYYHADEVALEALDGTTDGIDGLPVDVQLLPSGDTAFVASASKRGLVFYPGAKVQPEAYAPLLRSLAESGLTCVLVKPPFNLAILDTNAADGAFDAFPEITTWYVAGHSMGGVAACSYASSHEQLYVTDAELTREASGEGGDASQASGSSKLDGAPQEGVTPLQDNSSQDAILAGIVLLASYPADDLTDFPGSILSIYGTEDNVLNRQNYEEAKALLPQNAREIVIDGANHAGFGDYGPQAGDGEATITAAEQQAQTVQAIREMTSTQ